MSCFVSALKTTAPRILAGTFALLLITAPAFAATDTWDGGGADDRIGLNNNWLDNTAPVSDLVNTDLIFASGIRLTPSVSSAFSANSIVFDNTAGPFVIGGSDVLFIGAGGITNNDSQLQTISPAAILIGTPTSTFNAASGPLAIGTNLQVSNGQSLTITGGFDTSIANFVSNGTVTKNGAGTLNLAATSTQFQDLVVNAGAATMTTAATYGFNSSIAVNGTAIFNANQNLTLENGAQLTHASVLAASFNLAAGRTLHVHSGSDAIFTGNFTNNTASTVTVTGSGSTLSVPTGSLRFDAGALNVQAGGSASGFLQLDFAITGGTASATVDGAGSSLSGLATTIGGVSTFGGTGVVTLSNGSTASLGVALLIADSSSASAAGTLNVQSGATATAAGNINVSSLNGSGAGTITITGAGSALTQTQSGATTLTLGADTGGADALNVSSGGAFTSTTGLTLVNATGTVAIAGGTYNANGNFTLNGGQLARDAGGAFNLATGKTLTIQNGGDAAFTGGYAAAVNAVYNVKGSGSTLNATDGLRFADGASANVSGGGSMFSGSFIDIGTTAGTTGTLTVDGTGSSASHVSSAFTIGASGGVGSATFSNTGAGSAGDLNIAPDTDGSVGALTLQSGGDFTVFNDLNLAATSAATNGAITIDGPGSTLFHTAGPANIGANSGSTAAVNIQNEAVYRSSIGPTMVNATGTIALVNNGTFIANGDLTLNGGQLTQDAPGFDTFVLAGGTTFTIDNGGDATFTGGLFLNSPATTVVSGAGSTLSTPGAFGTLGVSGAATLEVTGGGTVSGTGILSVGIGSDAAVVVDGAGSSVSLAGAGQGTVGASGGSGSLTFRNGAAGMLSFMEIGVGGVVGTIGTLSIESGADVTIGTIRVAIDQPAGSGAVTVAGAGSTLTQSGASTLTLGAISGTTATLTASDGGDFTSGTGEVTLNATGTINVNGGTVTLNGPLVRNGGAVDFNSGALSIIDSLTVGTGGLLGTSLTLAANRQLTVGGTTTVDAFRTLTIDGGTFSTGALVNNGTLDFRRGTLGVTGAAGLTLGGGGPFGGSTALGTGMTVNVTNTANVASDAVLLLTGSALLNASGGINNSGEIRLEGILTRLGGGTLTNGGLVSGTGRIDNNLSNAATGTLRASIGERLVLAGATNANSGNVDLVGGTLEVRASLTNSSGASISGFGAIVTSAAAPGGAGIANSGVMQFSGGATSIRGDVSNSLGAVITTGGASVVTFFDDVVNQGQIRTNAGSRTVIFGAVSGAGSFPGTGVVEQLGDTRPGNSPAVVSYGGDLVFGDSSRLIIEIGGTTPGSEHDQLDVAGEATLAGVLVVSTTGGFSPSLPGESFTIINYGSHVDQFDQVVGMPSAAHPGLFWTAQYTDDRLILTTSALPGDIDIDADVDRGDAALFSQFFGRETGSIWTTGDFNGDGRTSLIDWGLLQSHLGQTVASPSALHAAVPEPSAWLLALFVLPAAGWRSFSRRLARRF